MIHQLNPIIKDFYNSILNYAGLKYDDACNYIINTNLKMGDLEVNGKKITLPFQSNLKNPNGRAFFHPLNENYISPESPVFLLFKKRLVCELNIKLSQLIINLIHVANSVDLQNNITDPSLIELISTIKGADLTLVENFCSIIVKSKVTNDEAFIFDIFLKKNGEIKGTPYAATGTVLFNMQKELTFAINDPAKDSRMFGFKLRKKDLASLQAILSALFGDTSQLSDYTQGSNNKVFRYLNILLSTSYMMSNIINKIAEKLVVIDDNTLMAKDSISDHEWVTLLPKIYELTNEIRNIPNQDEFVVDNKTPYHAAPVERINIDESKVANEQQVQQIQQVSVPQTAPQAPVLHPWLPQQQMPQAMPQQMAGPMSVEDIIKQRSQATMLGHAYQPPVQQYVQQQQIPVPNWIAASNMQQQPQMVMQQPMLQPVMQYTPQYVPQQPQFAPQPAMQQQVYINNQGYPCDINGRPLNQPYAAQPMQQYHQTAMPRQG